MNTRVEISLNFMPAFYHQRAGLRYGEAYYFDPAYRAQVECAEARFLWEHLGAYGVGSARPQASANLFIQPVDLIMRTQGAEWRMPENAALESWGQPWAALSAAAIRRIDPEAAARHPVIDAIARQYRAMRKIHGARADLFGLQSGTMNVHTPFTTAHQLYGGELLLLMLTEPDTVRMIFAKVAAMYRAIFRRIGRLLDAKPRRIQMGDCAASMLSPKTYRDLVLPANRAMAAGFQAVGYHSCGPSSHLLDLFRALPPLDSIELGPGTDWATAARLMPRTGLRPLIDPVRMRADDPDRIRALITGVLRATARSPRVTLCAWSFDKDTPLANVATMYRTVEAESEGEPKGPATRSPAARGRRDRYGKGRKLNRSR